MTEFVPTQKGTNIRNPSTALLTIDSSDRNFTSSPNQYDFQIQKNTNILSGFFTRLAVSEVVMEYANANITTGHNTLIVDISGDVSSPRTITLEYGNYTAYETLKAIQTSLNDLSGSTNVVFNLETRRTATLSNSPLITFLGSGTQWVLECVDKTNPATLVDFEITGGSLYSPLRVINLGSPQPIWGGGMPDLRVTAYLDIVSTQLTYCQDLKDASTSVLIRDSLCRFYLADAITQYDEAGLILYPGYLPIIMYRQYPFPKQIKWDNIQPIGNLQFQVYGSDGQLLNNDAPTNWQMSLLVSEV